MSKRTAIRLVTCLVLLACAQADAVSLSVRVDDGNAELADAVVSLHSDAARAASRSRDAELDQRDTQFAPHVLAITAGSDVSFPNRDNVRHHVYSFSPVKRFELPLYSGQPAQPVRFDEVGVATLGCNIHDWMIGYVVVLDTPYFAKTGADGIVSIEAPAGRYRLRVWHEHLAGTAPEHDVVLGNGAGLEQVSLVLKEASPSARDDEALDPRLLELQRKFRNIKRER